MAVMTETGVDETTNEEETLEDRPESESSESTEEPQSAEAPSTSLEEQSSAKIDLNQADQEDLQRLPGVGPKLASDIIAYREANGPFLRPEDITNVPGIGSVRYDEWADQLTATLPESELGEDVTPPPIPEVEEEFEIEEEESVAPEDNEEPAVPQIEVSPQLESPEERLSETEEESAEKPEPTPVEEARERRSLTWLWTALLGGVLGLIFSLIVMAGINQTLDYASSADMRALRQDLGNLSSDLDTLEGDLQDVQNQVNELADLTTRMEQAEADLETLRSTTETLQQQAEAMGEDLETVQTRVDALTSEVDEVQAQTETTMNFFEELRRLLQEMFGDVKPEARRIAPSARSLSETVGRS